MKIKGIIYATVVSSIVCSTVASATEFRATTVRALGMGGSNIASTNGVDASYWNPAAYGFFGEDDASAEAKSVDNSGLSDKVWGFDLGINAGFKAFGPLDKNTTILKSLVNPANISNAQLAAANVASTVADVATFSSSIASLDPAPLGISAFGDVTTGVRVANYGVGIRGSLDISGSLILDNQNARLDVLTALTGTANPAGSLVILNGAANAYFNGTQRQAMLSELTSPAGGSLTGDEAAAVIIAYEAALTTNNPSGIASQTAANNLVAAATAPGDITQNNTSWAVRGAFVKEVGITYGHALSERLSVGGVLKYIQADLFDAPSNPILGTNTDTAALDLGDTETSTGFGLDLGVMYRMPAWQFGLTVRNVNSPSFEYSPTGYIYKMEPQAKVGAAWMPSDTFTLELGYDVTENKGVVETDKTQYWNLGLEWDAFSVLAIRAGAYNNMAQTDIGLVTTLGLGINMWAVRLDIAGAISSNEITFEGETVPAYAMASLALSSDF